MTFLDGVLYCGFAVTALAVLFGVRTAFFAVYRARCPACGRRAFRYDQFNSDPWRRGSPGPTHRWSCEQCGIEQVQRYGDVMKNAEPRATPDAG